MYTMHRAPSSVMFIKYARAKKLAKVSLTRSQQDLIKPINSYRAAIIPDLWTPTAGKSWWFSNSIYPSLYRNLRVQDISLSPFKRRSWVVSALKGSNTYCSNKAACDSSSASKTYQHAEGTRPTAWAKTKEKDRFTKLGGRGTGRRQKLLL